MGMDSLTRSRTEHLTTISYQFVLMATLVLVIGPARAQDPGPDPDSSPALIETFSFSPPKRIKVAPPTYPRNYRSSGREGWVTVSMMVDTQGEPYDLRVIGSSGDALFEKAALRTMPKWRFHPAVLDSNNVDAAVCHSITFALTGEVGASRSYVKRYKKLSKAIQSGDRARSKELLKVLESYARSLYEQAYFHLGSYLYESKWGTDGRAYRALHRATFLDNSQGFLPEETLLSLLVSRLNHELNSSRFALAKVTAKDLLDRELDEDLRKQITATLFEIEQLVSAKGVIVHAGRIDDGNNSTHRLLRPQFKFRNVAGDIAELRLHCDKGYVGFTYDETLSYSVNPSYRECILTTIGTPGTTFDLVELAATP